MEKLKLSILTIVLVFTISCQDNGGVNPIDSQSENIGSQQSENFVGLSTIEGIAKSINFPSENGDANSRTGKVETKNIDDIHEVKNSHGRASFYVVNYDQGGFVILSSDKRTQPVLAFSLDGKFEVNESSYPPGLKFWMEDSKKQISDIQASDAVQSLDEKNAWSHVQKFIINEVSTSSSGRVDPIDCYDHTEIYTVGPLLSTTWYQTGAFNDALPYITCSGSSFQVYAGCVPIAMAQLMKYHQYPTSYSWSSMPQTYATTTTANFVKDIHTAIGNVYSGQPSYACDGTGVSASANMGNVLKSQFGYSSASWASYNCQTVKSNLSYSRPVLLSGDNGTTGHMWVCDGYKDVNYYYADCTGVGYLYYHMNWGWGGSSDGWYGFNNFNPAGTNFNSNKKMVYNIVP